MERPERWRVTAGAGYWSDLAARGRTADVRKATERLREPSAPARQAAKLPEARKPMRQVFGRQELKNSLGPVTFPLAQYAVVKVLGLLSLTI